MIIRLKAALCAATALLAGGCGFVRSDAIHYVYAGAAPCDDCAPASTPAGAPADDMIALALSGGGARASVFGAAAIEALAEAGVMARVTHLSSVSGGGFAAAYYALKKPAPCPASERRAGARCVSDEFAAFHAMMRRNFLTDLTLRQVLRPDRFSSPTRRLSSLADALDDAFIGGAAFADLPAAPVLLFNAARYDDARRFVFSARAIPDAPSDIPPFTEETLRTASFSLPGCARGAPAAFSVALAVAISAGFPPLLGPAAIEAPSDCAGGSARYWHLGDGGILDNTGVETLEDYALNAAPGARPSRVVILAMDAGRSASADIMMEDRNLRLWTSDPGRVVDIVGKRASAYREIALEGAYAATGVDFRRVTMRYTDAEIVAWPPSCGARAGGAAAIAAHLETIPTNFRITDCDADLMIAAARDRVARALADDPDLFAPAAPAPR